MFNSNKGKVLVDKVKNQFCIISLVNGNVYACTGWKSLESDAYHTAIKGMLKQMGDAGLNSVINAEYVANNPDKFTILEEIPDINDGNGEVANYTITATAGTGGTVDPTTQTVGAGSITSVQITPNAGYSIQDVLVDGVSVGAVNTYQFNNVQANHTITASFTQNGGGTPGETILVQANMAIAPEAQGFTYHPQSNNPITSDGTKWVEPAGPSQLHYDLPANSDTNILEVEVTADYPWSQQSAYGLGISNKTKNEYANIITVWDEGNQNAVGQVSGISPNAPRPQGGLAGNNKTAKIRLTRLSATQVQFDLFYDSATAFMQNVLNWDLGDALQISFNKYSDVGQPNIYALSAKKIV